VDYQSGTELPHSEGSADLIYAHASNNLGVIIFVGAIVVFVTALAGNIFKITRSKIALFFICLLPWASGMVFYRFISGQLVNAAIMGLTVSLRAIFALFVVIAIRISEKSRG
jgi:hypothetical protein